MDHRKTKIVCIRTIHVGDRMKSFSLHLDLHGKTWTILLSRSDWRQE